jgi:hypothetical protein
MARPEVTGRKVLDQAAFTIAEFCSAHRISQSMYFKMRNLGLGPREMAVGSRRLISQEAAAEWRKAREGSVQRLNKQHAPIAKRLATGISTTEKVLHLRTSKRRPLWPTKSHR